MSTSAPPLSPHRGMLRLPRVAARLSGSLTGGLMDLGVGGLAVETSARLAPRQRLEVHLGNGSSPLPTEIVWSNLHRTRTNGSDARPVYRAGGCFVALGMRDATRRLERLTTPAGGRLRDRRFRRFPAPGAPPVRLDVEHLVSVRALSSLGLRIEARTPLPESSVWTLDLDLGGPVLHPEVRVTGCEPLAPRETGPRWAVELEMVELADDEAKALTSYLRDR
jgi:hypothetical protein